MDKNSPKAVAIQDMRQEGLDVSFIINSIKITIEYDGIIIVKDGRILNGGWNKNKFKFESK